MNSWYSELSLMSNKSSSVLWQKVEFSRKEVGCVNILMWGWLYSISKDGTAKDVAHWCSTESRCKCCSYFICCVWSCFFTVSDFSIELKILFQTIIINKMISHQNMTSCFLYAADLKKDYFLMLLSCTVDVNKIWK